MTPAERQAASRCFITRSDNEFKPDGDPMIAAELLWGAVAHLLMAAGGLQQTPRTISNHSFYRRMAAELAAQDPSQQWQSELAAADQLHRYFYHRNLTDAELASRRATAKRLIANIDKYVTDQLAHAASSPTSNQI